MPLPIILPKFGFTLETADIVKWLVKEGDKVRSGDPICEVTTDKVNMEVESPEDGTIFDLKYPAGATVPVTEVICLLLRPGEAMPAAAPALQLAATPQAAPQPAPAASAPVDAGDVAATPLARRVAEAGKVALESIQGSGPHGKIMRRDVEQALADHAPDGKIRATPAARRIAEESGVDLAAVAGSGPHGRVQGADVIAAAQAEQIRAAAQQIAPKAEPVVPAKTVVEPAAVDAPKVVKLEGMRRTIATRLQKSFQTAPHIFFDTSIDMTGIEALRERLKAHKLKCSVTAIMVKAVTWTLQRHPWLNSTMDGDAVLVWPMFNIGVAVALDEGLVVPVVHHAERLALRDIQPALDTLVERARNNALHINDVTDGTFTISNLGMFGVDRFTAIINPPQVAILAVGRTVQQFVPDAEGKPALKPMMNVTLSADHRVVDGAHAAKFLSDLRMVLEEPGMLAW